MAVLLSSAVIFHLGCAIAATARERADGCTFLL